MALEESIEQTLHIARSVSLYRIPPRGPTGHVSGDWRVSDRLFEGRMRVVSIAERCEIRFEDAQSGELFAVSPIPFGMRTVYVEPATDSKRNFAVRVEDMATKQHAWLGMGFAERSDSFDFNEALLRHEKHVERERAAAALSGSSSSQAPQVVAPAHAMQELKALNADTSSLSLQEGQTIRVNVPKRGNKPGGLMSSQHAANSAFKLPL